MKRVYTIQKERFTNTLLKIPAIDKSEILEVIALLEEIPDGCAETFPFELIDSLKGEYL